MKKFAVIGRLTLLTLLGSLWQSPVALTEVKSEEIILGAITVESHMGEPLQVTIPLLKASEQSEYPTFKQVDALWGVPTDYAHQGGPTLSAKLHRESGKDSLVITSNQGMTIPFFTLLLKMVTEDRMIVRNMPVMLGERSSGSVASQQSVVPPPSHTPEPASSPMLTDLASNAAQSNLWKNLALGFSAAALFALSYYSLKGKRRIERWGLARGQVRKRPMAVPVAERQEPATLDTPPVDLPAAPPIQDSPAQPAPETSVAQTPVAKQESAQTTSKTVAKGVTITTVVRKKENSDKTPPTSV
ncbi:MAG: hypothetical protein HQL78_00465 [Magnetococcales bacterium]|nr:hypothetical protein [Magnetococcales bacterium]MBF0418622.1 hypothetical protein [Magnetococcales bacterium]